MITISQLTKAFTDGSGSVVAIDDVNLTIPDGSFVSIIGRSGSGKSTLLSLLGGLDQPTSGTIRVGDEIISAESDRNLIHYRRNTVGFVFQGFNLIPNLHALDNVMLPMEFAGVPKALRRSQAAELLNRVGLSEEKQLRRPAKLSGGEQQRVAIARALANEPAIILADEPTGNLDSKTGKLIIDLLKGLAKEGTTVIVVTHDRGLSAATDLTFELEDGKLLTA
jgi:putative ABC transport system ATP-binding protein